MELICKCKRIYYGLANRIVWLMSIYIVIKLLNFTNEERIIQAFKHKHQFPQKRKIQLILDFYTASNHSGVNGLLSTSFKGKKSVI